MTALTCASPMISDAEQDFACLPPLCVSLEKYLLKSSVHCSRKCLWEAEGELSTGSML